MPRWLEWIIALGALLVLSPFLLLLMAAIVIESPGWPLFFQRRIGVGGRPFRLIKLRKMPSTVPPDGKGITTQNDIRLTRMGRFMERFKLDEIPQLINILLGDMSLVGPRPEIPRFTKYYPDKWEKVLTVRPGLIGYSQIKVPHENDLYPPNCLHHEQVYIETILPEKLDTEIEYIQRKSTQLDAYVFFWVSYALLTKTITLRWFMVHFLHLFVLVADTLISCASLTLGFFLVHPQFIIGNMQSNLSVSLLVSLAIRPVVFHLFGQHRQPISSLISLHSFFRIIQASLYSSLAIMVTMVIFFDRDLIIRAHVIDFFLTPSFLIGARIFYVLVHDAIREKKTFASWLLVLKHFLLMASYGFLGFLTFWMAFIIRIQGVFLERLIPHWRISLFVVLIRAALSYFMWPPNAKTWSSFVRKDVINNIQVSLLGTGLIFFVYQVLEIKWYSRSSLLLDALFFSILTSTISLVWCLPRFARENTHKPYRILIYGTSISAELLLHNLQNDRDERVECLGVISDVEWKRFSTLGGIKIAGSFSDLPALIELKKPHALVVWRDEVPSGRYGDLEEICNQYGIKILLSPSLQSLQQSARLWNQHTQADTVLETPVRTDVSIL